MVMDLHPTRGGFLCPCGLGKFIKDYLLSEEHYG